MLFFVILVLVLVQMVLTTIKTIFRQFTMDFILNSNLTLDVHEYIKIYENKNEYLYHINSYSVGYILYFNPYRITHNIRFQYKIKYFLFLQAVNKKYLIN
jgi:hypothetical protein